jgi:PRTRC genetic system protein A
MYDVFVYKEGMDLPKEGIYFVVAQNGNFIHQDNEIFQCLAPVKNISCLDFLENTQKINLKLPKIPANLIYQVKEFFKLVTEKYRCECEVTIYFNSEKKHYKIIVPNQSATYSKVEYDYMPTAHVEEMSNYLRVGTIHSHCDFSAFHSSVDIDDEIDFNGLHIVFGNNDKDLFTISSVASVNGCRNELNCLDFIDGVEKVGNFYRLIPISKEEELKIKQKIQIWIQKVNNYIS